LLFLLILLVVLIFLYQLRYEFLFKGAIINMAFTLILSAIVYGTRGGKRVMTGLLVIGVPWIVLAWVYYFFEMPLLVVLYYLIMTVLFGYVISVLMRHIMEAERVSEDLLYGAGCIYLLLGYAWSGVYMCIELVRPGSFVMSGQNVLQTMDYTGQLVYFSFTTLTTLGYGDITPAYSLGRSVVILEAITGVLFMSMLVGILVGIYVAHSRKVASNRRDLENGDEHRGD